MALTSFGIKPGGNLAQTIWLINEGDDRKRISDELRIVSKEERNVLDIVAAGIATRCLRNQSSRSP